MTPNEDHDLPSCRQLVEHVSAYLDGELDDGTAARIEAHVDRCTGCGVYLEQMRLTLRLLGDAPPEPVSAELEQRLLDAFRSFRSEQDGG